MALGKPCAIHLTRLKGTLLWYLKDPIQHASDRTEERATEENEREKPEQTQGPRLVTTVAKLSDKACWERGGTTLNADCTSFSVRSESSTVYPSNETINSARGMR